MSRVCLFLLFVLVSFLTAAQSRKELNDSIRSHYIKRFPDHFFIWPLMKKRSTSLDIQSLLDRNKKISYKPNNAYGFGFGVYLFELLAEVTFAIPPNQQKEDQFGKSKASDLQINVLGKNWGADVFSQTYHGFYRDDGSIPVQSGLPYPQRRDISIQNIGLNGIYVFNKNKFSFRSAYNFTEKQLRSNGSFILTGTLNTFELDADSAIYGGQYKSVFGTKADFTNLRYTTLSVAPGYAYTFIAGGFFINLSASLGPAQTWVYYKSDGDGHRYNAIDSFLDGRAAFGYNGGRFFTGVSFVSQSRNMQFDGVRVTSSSSTFKFLFGYRFEEFGVLKKRVWDFLPKLGAR